jgi:hypothetical protein
MKIIKWFLYCLFIFYSSIGGCILGAEVGGVLERSDFTPWREIPPLPEGKQPVSFFLPTENDSGTDPLIKTSDGSAFFLIGGIFGEWSEGNDGEKFPQKHFNECGEKISGPFGVAKIPDPPGIMADQIECDDYPCDETRVFYRFVLLENHQLWVWEYSNDSLQSGVWELSFWGIGAILLCGIAIVVVGVVEYSLYRRGKTSRGKKVSVGLEKRSGLLKPSE